MAESYAVDLRQISINLLDILNADTHSTCAISGGETTVRQSGQSDLQWLKVTTVDF